MNSFVKDYIWAGFVLNSVLVTNFPHLSNYAVISLLDDNMIYVTFQKKEAKSDQAN
jgi:hypothetical protein